MIIAPIGEADDAIGIYVHGHEDYEITIVSNDRDLWQLIRTNVKVFSVIKGQKVVVDVNKCRRLLGVSPEKVAFLKAILGDKSDNIPRAVPRLPTKYALKLANEIEDIKTLEEHIQGSAWLKGKAQQKILEAAPVIRRNYALVKIHTNMPMLEELHKADISKLMDYVPDLDKATATKIAKG